MSACEMWWTEPFVDLGDLLFSLLGPVFVTVVFTVTGFERDGEALWDLSRRSLLPLSTWVTVGIEGKANSLFSVSSTLLFSLLPNVAVDSDDSAVDVTLRSLPELISARGKVRRYTADNLSTRLVLSVQVMTRVHGMNRPAERFRRRQGSARREYVTFT